MDLQHIHVISLSAEVDNEILSTRVLIDDFIIENDSTILNQIPIKLDTITAHLEKLSIIFISDFKKIDNNDLKDFSDEYKIIISKLSALKYYISKNNLSNEFSESGLLTVYKDFIVRYHHFGQYLQKYLYENTNIYRREFFALLVIVFLFMILAGYLIIHLINQLIIADRKEIQKTIEIEGRERQRIAADLHDGFGAYLSSIIMHIQILENDYGENLVLRKKIENLNQLSRQALQSIEEVINNLNPTLLSRIGLVKTLEKTISKINLLDKTQFLIDSLNLHLNLFPSIEIMLYRICLELINNALKHSHAKNAKFTFYNIRKKVHLIYEDNGIGFENEESTYKNNKTGLYNLAKRVESVGGNYLITSEPDKGVHVKIILDLN
ncbi:MAG: histidine kinase [Salinivirgaceae bacterium]|nr:histidine kinase [Salinivirgaceae bacterium]